MRGGLYYIIDYRGPKTLLPGFRGLGKTEIAWYYDNIYCIVVKVEILNPPVSVNFISESKHLTS